MNKILWVGLLITIQYGCFAQNLDKEIRKGNDLYGSKKYVEAKAQYDKVLEENPNNEKAIFNGGNASFKQEDYEQALTEFATATSLLKTNEEKAMAYYNLGNTYYKSQQYDKSVEAYKDALRLNPKDIDTKYNLQMAQKMLQQQQEQDQQNQDQNNQDQENEENQDQENKDDQNQQDGDQEDEENEQQNQEEDGEQGEQTEDQSEQQGGEEGDQQEEEQSQEQQIQPSKLSKAEAERILEALMNQEQSVQEKLIEKETQKGQKINIEKDW